MDKSKATSKSDVTLNAPIPNEKPNEDDTDKLDEKPALDQLPNQPIVKVSRTDVFKENEKLRQHW